MRGLDTLTHRTTTVTLAAHARRGLIMYIIIGKQERANVNLRRRGSDIPGYVVLAGASHLVVQLA